MNLRFLIRYIYPSIFNADKLSLNFRAQVLNPLSPNHVESTVCRRRCCMMISDAEWPGHNAGRVWEMDGSVLAGFFSTPALPASNFYHHFLLLWHHQHEMQPLLNRMSIHQGSIQSNSQWSFKGALRCSRQLLKMRLGSLFKSILQKRIESLWFWFSEAQSWLYHFNFLLLLPLRVYRVTKQNFTKKRHNRQFLNKCGFYLLF